MEGGKKERGKRSGDGGEGWVMERRGKGTKGKWETSSTKGEGT